MTENNSSHHESVDEEPSFKIGYLAIGLVALGAALLAIGINNSNSGLIFSRSARAIHSPTRSCGGHSRNLQFQGTRSFRHHGGIYSDHRRLCILLRVARKPQREKEKTKKRSTCQQGVAFSQLKAYSLPIFL